MGQINEHIYKTETESQTENKLTATREESRVGINREIGRHIHTIIYKRDN